jgi:hypothetical protein
MFLLGLNFGGVIFSWSSAPVICLLLFGSLTLAAFVIYEMRGARYPLMPPRIFQNRSNLASLSIPFLHGIVFIANSYFLPQYFQVVLGVTPLMSGIYLLPYIVTGCLLSAGAGFFVKYTGLFLPPIYFGMSFLILGTGLYIDLPPYTSFVRVIIYQIIVGLGSGPNFQAPLIALHSGVEPRDTAAATSMFNFARNMGTAISVVIGGSIFQNQIAARHDQLYAVLPPAIAHQLSGGNVGGARDIVNMLPPEQQTVVKTVYTDSLRTLWIFYTVIAMVGLVASLFIKKKVLSTTHKIHKTGLQTERGERKEDVVEEKEMRDLEAR